MFGPRRRVCGPRWSGFGSSESIRQVRLAAPQIHCNDSIPPVPAELTQTQQLAVERAYKNGGAPGVMGAPEAGAPEDAAGSDAARSIRRHNSFYADQWEGWWGMG